jgi:hypothetical protein
MDKPAVPQWFGVVGDGSTDDTSKMQRFFNACRNCYIPGLVYAISATGLSIPSNTRIEMAPTATFKAVGVFPNTQNNPLISFNSVTNIQWFGGIVDGNKASNPTGRIFGIYVIGNSSKILLQGVTAQNCPAQGGPPNTDGLGGDGIAIGQAGAVPFDIKIIDCNISGNVRTGIAVIECEEIVISGCTIENTSGFNTGAGIDIETESGSSTSKNITVIGNIIRNNVGGGVFVVSRVTDDMSGITISGNVFEGNSSTSSVSPSGVYVGSHRQGLTISGNNFELGPNACVEILGSAGVSVVGNSFKGNYNTDERSCVRAYSTSSGDVENLTISGNIFYKTQQSAINLDCVNAGSGNIKGVSIVGNTMRDCVGPAGIAATPVISITGDATRNNSYVTISGNSFLDTRGAGAANYAIGITGAATIALINTFVLLGNVVTGFGAGTPYSGSASNFNLAPTNFSAARAVVTDANKAIGTGNLFWDELNKYLGVGAAGARNLDIQVSNPGGGISARIKNTDNSAGANVQLQLETAGALTKESSISYTYTGLAPGSRWTQGRYHVTGHYIIAQSSDLTSSAVNAIDIDNSLNVEISNGNCHIAKGDLKVQTVGKGLYVKEGANATMGRVALVAGTIVVNTTKVTANSEIHLTSQIDGGTPGFIRVSARVNGTSFTILSSNAADTSTIGWIIIEPS